MDAFDNGDLVTVSVVIQTALLADSDPPVLYFYYWDPDGGPTAPAKGTLTTPYIYGTDAQIIKDATGHYHIDLPVTKAGKWRYKWQSLAVDATVRGATSGTFRVKKD